VPKFDALKRTELMTHFRGNKILLKRNHFFVENVLRNLCYRLQLRAVYGSRVLILHDEVVMSDELDPL